MPNLDTNIPIQLMIIRTGISTNLGVFGTEFRKKAISLDFGVPDVGSRILERTVTLGPNVINVTARLSSTAGLLAWLSDRGVQVGGLLDLEPALTHTFSLRFPAGAQARTLRVNLEVVNR